MRLVPQVQDPPYEPADPLKFETPDPIKFETPDPIKLETPDPIKIERPSTEPSKNADDPDKPNSGMLVVP